MINIWLNLFNFSSKISRMKNFINVLLWFIGLFLCLLAILGFVNGNILFSFIFLAIGVLLLPPVYKKIGEWGK
ncbi:MAG: hypothetical protein DRI95_05350 [Bacteroidetes bacterium]|nr:MAG: hypothetical protein DRI95_05350 [Bacteroidota bacterium]